MALGPPSSPPPGAEKTCRGIQEPRRFLRAETAELEPLRACLTRQHAEHVGQRVGARDLRSRKVPRSRIRCADDWRATNSSSRSEGTSAACRSSRTIRTGWRAAARCHRPVIASNNWKRAWAASDGGCSDGCSGNRDARLASSTARCGAAAPSVARAVVSSCAATYCRTACSHGQYGGAPASSGQRPHSTRRPRPAACSATCCAMRLADTRRPGKHPTRPWPARAS